MKEYSYRVLAFNEEKDSKMYDVCACEVIAKDEKEAIKQAKKMVNKNHYHVREARDIDKMHELHA